MTVKRSGKRVVAWLLSDLLIFAGSYMMPSAEEMNLGRGAGQTDSEQTAGTGQGSGGDQVSSGTGQGDGQTGGSGQGSGSDRTAGSGQGSDRTSETDQKSGTVQENMEDQSEKVHQTGEAIDEEKIFRVILPTDTSHVFDFIMDPQQLQ